MAKLHPVILPPSPLPAAHPPYEKRVVVIHPQYCAPYPVDLKVLVTTEGPQFAAADTNGNTMFVLKGKHFSIRGRRVLYDAHDNPVVTLRPKMMTAHKRWLAFKGDSKSLKDILFSAKMSHLFQQRSKLKVVLARRIKEGSRSFKIQGKWKKRCCTVYAGKGRSKTILAQIQKRDNVEVNTHGDDSFFILVNASIDYAFIVALMAILNEIHSVDDEKHSKDKDEKKEDHDDEDDDEDDEDDDFDASDDESDEDDESE